MQAPRKLHLDIVGCIMRYVMPTLHFGLFHETNSGYVDED